MGIKSMVKRLAGNTNESLADDRKRLAANTNESAQDDVEAHGLVANTTEDTVADE
jgi:hypothetical protein